MKSKEDVLRIEFEGLKIGDLVYDTYLRYLNRPTINLKNPILILIIYKSYCIINSLNHMLLDLKKVFLSYSTYISHGIPSRYFLNKGIEVYAMSSFNKILKRIEKNNPIHLPNYFEYKKQFEKQKNIKFKIDSSIEKLENRFSGKNDLTYLKDSPYSNQNHLVYNFDGIVFLHDFLTLSFFS